MTPSIATTISEVIAARYDTSSDDALAVVADAEQVSQFIESDLSLNGVKGQVALVVLFGDKLVDNGAKVPFGQSPPVGMTAVTVVTHDGILVGGLLVADKSDEFAKLGAASRLSDLVS